MSIFSRLNPTNSLFGRIFVWFWLATGLMVFAVILVVNRVSDPVEVLPLTKSQQKMVVKIESAIEKIEASDFSTRQIMKKLARMNNWLVVRVDPNTKHVNIGFPRPIAGRLKVFADYSLSDKLIRLRNKNADFVGPFELTTNGEVNILFIGRVLPKAERVSRAPIFIYGGIIVLILGSVFCGVLVWHLTRPIKQISEASRQFAKGKLDTRVNGYDKRKDEIGLLSKDFNKMAAQIENTIDNQRMLMANVSHELRTPLTRMQLALALLEGAEGNTNILQKNIDRLSNDISKMDGLIEQILNISKAQSSHSKLDFCHENISELVTEIVEETQLEASNRHIQTNLQITDNIYSSIDKAAVRSAIENIIRNALKFAKFSVNIQVYASKNGENVCVVVDDDGCGVSDEQLALLFEPFYRAKSVGEQNTENNGTGLGLAIAKAAIDAHNGSIEAQKSPFGGLNMTIILPKD
ncbi:ATP-binding protein [Glaciecola sp. KUL10]|uniref:ATP-binding protein n=1 Tax=Glaciecola sp. (strain KUL10) TaxID=2161813 RepID=UPI001313F779|nr:ATP-binding protein [Glaciecola sp. KUL10]